MPRGVPPDCAEKPLEFHHPLLREVARARRKSDFLESVTSPLSVEPGDRTTAGAGGRGARCTRGNLAHRALHFDRVHGKSDFLGLGIPDSGTLTPPLFV